MWRTKTKDSPQAEIIFIYISSALWAPHSWESASLTVTSILSLICSVASSSLLPSSYSQKQDKRGLRGWCGKQLRRRNVWQPKLCVNHYSRAAKSVSLRPSKLPAAIILSYLRALTIAVLFYRDLQKTLKDGLVEENYPEISQGSNSSVNSREGLCDPL